jgi:tetratricopeptide (TPR) repeat protein
VARHLELGGQEPEAAAWYVRAGDLAAAEYAQAEAEAAYRSALALGHPSSGEVNFALGEVLLLAGRYQEALDVFQIAAVSAGSNVAAKAEHRMGEVHRRLGRFDLAQHHFELAEAGHPEPSALCADWALLEHRQGRSDRSVSLAERAVLLAEESNDAAAEARARDVLGIVLDDAAEVERALQLAGDEPIPRLAALNSLAHALARDGNLERAALLVEEGIALARTVGDRHREAALLNHLADLHHRADRPDESRRVLTEAVRLFAGIEPNAWEPEVWMLTRW